MNILLTGGSGFIGKNILEGLGSKYTFFAPSHLELNLLDAAQVSTFLQTHKIDLVIHSAVGRGDTLYGDTMIMFGNLLRHLGSIDRMIYLGSGAEFAKNRDLAKVKEAEIGQFIPQDPYGLAKYICNDVIRAQRKIVNLRLFGIYGKYENYLFKFISNTIAKVMFDLDIEIMQDVVFDYLYVPDFVKVVDHFILHDTDYPDYNITPTESIKISELAKMAVQVSGKKIPVTTHRPGLNFQYTGDNARLLESIPDFAFTSYQDGITDLWNYYASIASRLDLSALQNDVYKQKVNLKPSV